MNPSTQCLAQSLAVLLVALLLHTRATKIIDYDNVVENPYYRKSNLDLLIRRHCNFLQVKTSSTPPPTKPKFSDRLKNAFAEQGKLRVGNILNGSM